MSEYISELIDPSLPYVHDYDDKYDSSPIGEVVSAASAGDVAAMYELGSRYRLGVDGVEQDYVKAIEWYKKVLRQQNNVNAFYHIGYMIVDGAYGEGKDAEALPYLYAAYSMGDAVAAIQLGIQYEYGEFVPQDIDKALEFYFFAAERGDKGAYFNIGEAYRRLNNIPEAIRYYEMVLDYEPYKEDAEQRIAELTGPERYVEQTTELLASDKLMDAYNVITEGFRYFNNDLRIIYKLVETDDIVLQALYLTGRFSADHENMCRILLDLINTLRSNSFGDPAKIDKYESDIYFFLGDLYLENEQMDEALGYLERADVGHTPHAAYGIFLAHVYDVGKNAGCFRHDAELFERALRSGNWPTDKQKALAYYGLSALYANNFPGLPVDLQYAYECAKKSNELDSRVGGPELAKYSISPFGRITYTP